MVKIIILIHIVAGSMALMVGLVPLASKKGGIVHRRYGLYFLRLMAIVLLSAFLALLFKFNAFLFALTVLSLYLAFSGYRVVKRKENAPSITDWMMAGSTLIVSLVCLWLTFKGYFKTNPVILYPTIGGCLLYSTYDLARFLTPGMVVHRYLWLFEHIAKMSGAYIAIVAAFSGTVLTMLPKPFSQIWASAIGTPLTIIAIFYYYRRLKRDKNLWI